jgi:hypothetical protein
LAQRRLPAFLLLCGILLAACGGGGTALSTTVPGSPLTFYLNIDDSGSDVLQVHVGDSVVPRLPLTGTEDAGWVLSVPPNPTILGGGDDLRFFPSEVGQGGAAYHEFSFIAVGTGRTSFTLTHGLSRFLCTVEVAPVE